MPIADEVAALPKINTPPSALPSSGSIIPDEILSLPKEQPARPALASTYEQVATVQPDKAAQVQQVAKAIDQDPALVDAHLADAQAAAAVPDDTFFREFEAKYPKSAKFVGDPKNMAVVKDQFDNLALHEKLFKEVASGWHTGSLGVRQSEIDWQQMLDTLKTGKYSTYGQQELNDITAKLKVSTEEQPGGNLINNPHPLYWTAQQLANWKLMGQKAAVRGVQSGLVFGIGAAAASAVFPPAEAIAVPGATLAGLSAGSAMGIAEASAILEGGNSFEDFKNLRDKNGNAPDPRRAATAALAVGAVNAGLEYAQIEIILKRIPGGEQLLNGFAKNSKIFKGMTPGKLLRKAAIDYAFGIGGEVVTEMGQQATQIIGREATKAGGEFEPATTSGNVDEILSVINPTVQSMMLMNLPGPVLHNTVAARIPIPFTGQSITTDLYMVRQAQADKARYEQLMKASADSKLRQRMPEKYEEHLGELAKGTPAENIYIPVEAAETYFQSQNIDTSSAMQELGVTDQYAAAKEGAHGGRIEIPIARWATYAAGTTHSMALNNDIAFNASTPTANEAVAINERVHTLMQEQVDAAKAETADIDTSHVYNDIKTQLTAVPRPANMNEKDWARDIDMNAKLWAARVATETARRPGSTTQEVYNSVRPRIMGGNAVTAAFTPYAPADAVTPVHPAPDTAKPLTHLSFAPYLQQINDDLQYDLIRGKRMAIKDDRGNIIDWKGHKNQTPSWLPTPNYYGNPKNLSNAVDKLAAGKPISPKMETILRDVVKELRQNRLREVINERYRKQNATSFNQAMTPEDMQAVTERFEKYHATATAAGHSAETATRHAVAQLANETVHSENTLHQSAKDVAATPEFKKWFGDSKVVDEKGNPLVVYHGTFANFQSFDKSKTKELGIHFGTDEQANNRIGNDRFVGYIDKAYNELSSKGLGPNVMPVYLTIENPLWMPSDIGNWGDVEQLKEYFGPANYEVFTAKEIKKLNSISEFEKALKGKGYDGIRYSNEQEGSGDSWIVFDPEQIKSATGNKGTFDGNNPNILYQEHLPEYQKNLESHLREIEKLKESKSDTSREAIYKAFDNTPKPIGEIAQVYADYLGVKDPVVYTGTAHFIDHHFNNEHPNTAAEYRTIMDVLQSPDDVKENIQPNNRGLILIKKFDKHHTVVVNVDIEKGNILLHKTFFTQEKEPYRKLPSVKPLGVDDGASSISRASSDAPGGNRFSARTPSNSIDDNGNIVKGPRAAIEFTNGGPVIKLFSSADASSFLHESGHLWLKDMFDFVRSGKATSEYTAHFITLAEYLGIDEKQTELTKPQQEKFARTMEAYLMEGKAPSSALQRVFSTFKKWLLRIYRDVSVLGVEITPPVRGVMDRMFATDEEIAVAEKYMNMDKPVDVRHLTPEHATAMQDLQASAHEEAKAELMRLQMAELDKERLDDMAAVRTHLTSEAMKELDSQPLYKAYRAVHGSFGFHKNVIDIAEMYATGKLLPEGMVRFDSIAERNGYSSGGQLVHAIRTAPPVSRVLSDIVEPQIAARFPEIKDTLAIKDAARKAVHNAKQLEFIAAEMGAIEGDHNIERARLEASAAKEKAIEVLGNMKAKDAIQYMPYITAERNAAMGYAVALKDGVHDTKWIDTEGGRRRKRIGAVEFKQRQLLNHALATESMRLAKEFDELSVYLEAAGQRTSRTNRGGKINITADANVHINRILARYGFTMALPEAETGTQTLTEYANALKEHGDDVVLADWIMENNVPATKAADLTIGQLEDLKDAVASLRKSGQRENTLSTGEDIDTKAAEIAGQVRTNLKEHLREYNASADSLGQTTKNIITGFVAAHRNLTWITRAMDGYKVGPISQFVMGRLRAARAEEGKMGTEVNKALERIWDKHYPAVGKTPYMKWSSRVDLSKPTIFFTDPKLKAVFKEGLSRENLIMIALNQGTWTNRKRIVESYAVNDGMGWRNRIEQYHIDLALESLNKNDWDFVQDIIDLTGSFWPKIAALQRNRTGIEPRKQEAVKILTKYGEYKGGYFHIEYDPRYSLKAETQILEDSMKAMVEGSHIIPSTRRGHTKARFQRVMGRPLLLQFGVIDRHLNAVIHDLSFMETVRDIDRVTTHRDVQTAVCDTLGRETYKQIRAALGYVGYETRPQTGWPERAASWVRARTTAFYLGYRISSIMSQIAGAGPAMASVGVIKYLGAQMAMAKDRSQYQFVLDNSRIMKDRLGNRDRDIRDAMKTFSKQGNVLDDIAKHGFFLQGYMDILVAMPQWMAAYTADIQKQHLAGKEVNENEAITVADETVQSTQGSGDPIDLASVQRGGEFYKLLTMFFTPFLPVTNKQIEVYEKLRDNGVVKTLPEVMGYLSLWILFPAMASGLLTGQTPASDDDADEWIRWTITETIKQQFGGWILLRDAASFVFSQNKGTTGYRMTAAQSGFEIILKPAKDIYKMVSGDNVSAEKAALDMAKLLAFWFRQPGRQAEVTLGGIVDLVSGNNDASAINLLYPKK
jgi:hypothetical protein